jgi:hypothetical protein
MSRIERKQGDARLGRDGSVRLNGATVGVWWRDEYHWYHFALKQGDEPIVSRFFRHELMSAIAENVGPPS